jgi:hypothetical protein
MATDVGQRAREARSEEEQERLDRLRFGLGLARRARN